MRLLSYLSVYFIKDGQCIRALQGTPLKARQHVQAVGLCKLHDVSCGLHMPQPTCAAARDAAAYV